MVSQQIGAEAVDGGDLGSVQQCLLALEVAVLRILRQSFLYGSADALPHLGRCSSGKGHHQQLVDVRRHAGVLGGLCHQADDPFHQDGGLAAAGGGRYEYVVISCVQHALLVYCKVHGYLYLSYYGYTLCGYPVMPRAVADVSRLLHRAPFC